ncbi:MAG: hypothetical protein ABWX92_05405, partial [Mycetocola sp.]
MLEILGGCAHAPDRSVLFFSAHLQVAHMALNRAARVHVRTPHQAMRYPTAVLAAPGIRRRRVRQDAESVSDFGALSSADASACSMSTG